MQSAAVLLPEHFVNEGGHRETARLVSANGKAKSAQITVQNNSTVQKGISECTTSQALKWFHRQKGTYLDTKRIHCLNKASHCKPRDVNMKMVLE